MWRIGIFCKFFFVNAQVCITKMRKTQASLKSDSESISHIILLQSSQKTSIIENGGQKNWKNFFLEVIKSPKNEQDL